MGTVSVLSENKEREFNLGVNGMKGMEEYGRYCTREVGNHEARVKEIDIRVRKESGKNDKAKRRKKGEDGGEMRMKFVYAVQERRADGRKELKGEQDGKLPTVREWTGKERTEQEQERM